MVFHLIIFCFHQDGLATPLIAPFLSYGPFTDFEETDDERQEIFRKSRLSGYRRSNNGLTPFELVTHPEQGNNQSSLYIRLGE